MVARFNIQIDCAVSRHLLAVHVLLSVETLAGDHREVSVTIGGNPWVRQVEVACAGPAEMPGEMG